MDGLQHYEAERVIAEHPAQDGESQEIGFPEAVALAQVRATLALAVAVAVKTSTAEDAWTQVTRSSPGGSAPRPRRS